MAVSMKIQVIVIMMAMMNHGKMNQLFIGFGFHGSQKRLSIM